MLLAAPSLAQDTKPTDAGVEEAEATQPKSPAAARVSAPDVVMLNNGGLVRGTISELVPNDYVLIITVTGEQRRYPLADVSYAGPADGAPKSSPPASAPAPEPEPAAPPSQPKEAEPETRPMVSVRAKEAQLKLLSIPAGMTFHRRAGSATAAGPGGVATATSYDEMCTAPCEVSIPAGTHTLALSQPGSSPVAADPVSIPEGSSTLTGTYTDRSTVRTMGFVATAVGVVAGVALILTAKEEVQKCDIIGCYESSETNTTKVFLGGALMGVGALVGWILVSKSDEAQISVNPGVSTARARPATHHVAMADRLQGEVFPGLSLNVPF